MTAPVILRDSEKSPEKSGHACDTVAPGTSSDMPPIRTIKECADQLGISEQAANRIEQSFFRKVWQGMQALQASLEHAA